MSNVLERPTKSAGNHRLTLQALHNEMLELRERVEDLEDLRELNKAIEHNKSKPLIPWSRAKKQLGLG